MALYRKRDKFSGISIKIGTAFSRLGLSPNQWTLFSVVPAFIAFYFLLGHDFLMAAVFMMVSSFIDLVDGSVARVMGKSTKLGAYLDTVVDRYIEAIIIFGLLLAGIPDFYGIPFYAWIFLYLFGGMMTTYVKAAAKEKELTEREIKGGILERAERLILLFIGLVLAYYSRLYLTYIIVILAVLSNITAYCVWQTPSVSAV